jgi:glycerophosphoryl diester phosphodiesterase
MRYHYCLFIFAFIISCSNTKNTAADPMQSRSFDTQGHRGSRGLMPENTFPAMKTALDLGVSTLEMDVVITKDKKVILSHEPFFNHEITTKPDGSYVAESEEKSLNIYKMDYEEVRKYDVGMKSHPRFPQQQKIKVFKPLLSDLLDSVQNYMTTSKRAMPYFNIETKSTPSTDNLYHPEPPEFVERLMTVIEEKEIQNRVIIQSFDFRTLQYLHKKYPSIMTAILIEDFDERGIKDQLKALGFVPTIYSPEYKMVTEDLVKKCHEQNIKIIPWTVNDKETMDRLKTLGVDGVISDYPNLFNE